MMPKTAQFVPVARFYHRNHRHENTLQLLYQQTISAYFLSRW